MVMAMLRLNVLSEVEPLEQVIVHTPGEEMERVSPESRQEMLFDDILFVRHAREEHELMCAVFRKIVGREDAVLQLRTLLREALVSEDARLAYIDELVRVQTEHNLAPLVGELKRLSPDELVRFSLTGVSPLQLHLPPIPNLMFTRDVAAVVGNSIVLSHPATAARARESAIMNVVVQHHPSFADYRDRVVKLPQGVSFEGGDLLVLSDRAVLVGHSERTSFGGVMSTALALFEQTSVRSVILVNIPKRRSCMHLDTVFTFTKPDECVMYPPIIEATGRNNVLELTPGETPSKVEGQVHQNLQGALESVLDRKMTFIPCGGLEKLDQQREQWTDGANFFAIAPGVVIGYERNPLTFQQMRKHGYRVVTASGFLSYHEESNYEPGEKLAIKLDGKELSRGRGGPRCMTMPLSRATPSG